MQKADNTRVAQSIFRGMLLVSVLLAVAKITVAARDVAFAWRFGAGIEADAYVLSSTILTWLPNLFAAVGSIILIPLLVSGAIKGAQEKFVAELNVVVATIAALFTLVIAAGAAAILATAVNISDTYRGALRLVLMFSPIAFFGVISQYQSLRLQSLQRYTYTVAEAVPSIFIIIAIGLSAAMSGSVVFASAGLLVGTAAQAAVLARMLQGNGAKLFSPNLKAPEWAVIAGGAPIVTVALMIHSLWEPMDQMLALELGPGNAATVGYASRFLMLGRMLIATAIARVILPVLAQQIERGDHRAARDLSFRFSGLLFLAGWIVVVLVWTCADWGVALLLERGHFGHGETLAVAEALRFGALHLPFFFVNTTLVQLIAVKRNWWFFLAMNIFTIVSKYLSAVIMIPDLGIRGIMASTGVMYGLSSILILLYLFWNERSTKVEYPKI